MQGVCAQFLQARAQDVSALLDVGGLLHGYGFLLMAQQAFEQACRHAPQDLRAAINLANVLRDLGEHGEARRLYDGLASKLPDHPMLRRNLLTGMEYDPDASDEHRVKQARAWGQWAIERAGGERPRPAAVPLNGRPLRVGYVSADFCQHTVGLFVKDVIKAHAPQAVAPFAYSAGAVQDWVTKELRQCCEFRDVRALDDPALAQLIQDDAIDVLVDLSGHTAGSRLTALAYRPAAVMVSWLGYFATTGLRYMDAVVLDEWHAPPGMASQFVEPIVSLPGGRFCYQPVPWAPTDPALPPFERKGHISFGCFNNTAKLNAQVLDTWAGVLKAVPDARLVLKWRTFNDDTYRRKLTAEFASRGVAPDRLELRGPSFHADVLKEYADIDIALDPFPFTGGLTSCEALWMGVPVVTWPQSRVVSRQTFAFLSAIGLAELAAESADDYVGIASALAQDPARLHTLRSGMRARMQRSPLMDVEGFARRLEGAFVELFVKAGTPLAQNPGGQTPCGV